MSDKDTAPQDGSEGKESTRPVDAVAELRRQLEEMDRRNRGLMSTVSRKDAEKKRVAKEYDAFKQEAERQISQLTAAQAELLDFVKQQHEAVGSLASIVEEEREKRQVAEARAMREEAIRVAGSEGKQIIPELAHLVPVTTDPDEIKAGIEKAYQTYQEILQRARGSDSRGVPPSSPPARAGADLDWDGWMQRIRAERDPERKAELKRQAAEAMKNK